MLINVMLIKNYEIYELALTADKMSSCIHFDSFD